MYHIKKKEEGDSNMLSELAQTLEEGPILLAEEEIERVLADIPLKEQVLFLERELEKARKALKKQEEVEEESKERVKEVIQEK